MPMAFTAKQAMEALNISRSKFYNMAKRGEIKVVKAGKKILVPAWAISDFLGENARPNTCK